jgi:hypothetical protein
MQTKETFEQNLSITFKQGDKNHLKYNICKGIYTERTLYNICIFDDRLIISHEQFISNVIKSYFIVVDRV